MNSVSQNKSAIVIVNWNSETYLRTCLESAFQTCPESPIVVIDNASTDGSAEAAHEFGGRVTLIRNRRNRGLAAGMSQGFAATATPYVLMLNPDVRATAGALQRLESFMDGRPAAGAIGGYVNDRYLPRRLPTPGALIAQNLGIAGKSAGLKSGTEPVPGAEPVLAEPILAEPVQVDQPAAAAILIRRAAHDAIGGFDERFYPAWYEDVDFCCRLKAAGWEVYFAPGAVFIHEGGYSAKAMGSRAFAGAYYHNQLRYARKHFGKGAQMAIRLSMAAGMAARMIARPSEAGSRWSVLVGALGAW